MIESKQYGSSTVFVGEPAENWRKDQLHDRVGGKEQPDRAWCAIEFGAFGVIRKDGNNDTETEQVDKDRSEDNNQWGALSH